MLNSIIYPYIKRKKDSLKRRVDIRGDKIWMGPKPKPIDQSDLVIGDVLFCGSAESDKATTLIQNMTDGAYVHCGVYIGNGIVADIATSGARKIKFESFYETIVI
ncbi:hypothetical protein [Pseudoalteromonas phenolica]|uniref:hypothetical protein n=1 Tax=Pseudoalteromonas phenolica TaxID=161398 RepID=UPI000FFED48D|nr:hypothetical protein [Pseudoalteromonas phenolica]RXF02019.1 hypothetical protein D9981_07865 [Pseudoalteromonas phenolica O-BC30]